MSDELRLYVLHEDSVKSLGIPDAAKMCWAKPNQTAAREVFQPVLSEYLDREVAQTEFDLVEITYEEAETRGIEGVWS